MDSDQTPAPAEQAPAPATSFEQLLGVDQPAAPPPADADAEVRAANQAQDDAPADDAPAGDLFTVKVDGQEIQVSREELLNGYSRQADYSRKTQELAAQRAEVAQVAQAVMAERQQYQAQLAQMQQALGRELQEQSQIDWNGLLESDPVEYLKQRHLAEQRQAAYQQATEAQQRAQIEAQQMQVQQHQAQLQSEHQALLDKLPDWQDATKATAERAQMRDFLLSAGFRADEVGSISDHRAVLIARKAMLYDQMVTQAQSATQRVQALPARVQRPGVSMAPADGRSSAMRALAKTGSTTDGARAFEAFLR